MKSGIKQKNVIISLIACFVILLVGFGANLPAYTSSDAVLDFDWWSESILVSDLIYNQNYDSESAFLHCVSPMTINPEDWTKAQGIVTEYFIDNRAFDESMFSRYDSNIVVQHYIYRALDRILPISNVWLLRFLHAINYTLLSMVLTMILWWLSKIVSPTGNVIIVFAILLSVCAPYLMMYGENLYWCAWSLFLPMLMTIWVVQNRKFADVNSHKQWIVLALAAFLGCAVKQLFYFEFVSTVMVAMTIPLFYWMNLNEMNFLKQLHLLSAQVVGAFLSFVMVFAIKCALLISEDGVENGMKRTWELIVPRLLDQTASGQELETPAAQASHVEVLFLMLSKTVFELKGVGKISALGLMILVFVVTLVFIKINKKRQTKDKKTRALVVATIISALAPLSWFVMAKPHTYNHNVHCSIAWFCPFVFLAMALLVRETNVFWTLLYGQHDGQHVQRK